MVGSKFQVAIISNNTNYVYLSGTEPKQRERCTVVCVEGENRPKVGT
jgi:hypothetical protein